MLIIAILLGKLAQDFYNVCRGRILNALEFWSSTVHKAQEVPETAEGEVKS